MMYSRHTNDDNVNEAIAGKYLFELNHLFLRKHYKLAVLELRESPLDLNEKVQVVIFWTYSALCLKIFQKFPSQAFGFRVWDKIINHEHYKGTVGAIKLTIC